MAALSGTLPPQNSYCGPFKSSAGKYYVLLRGGASSQEVRIWWATDPTGTTPWTEITTNAPSTGAIASMNGRQRDDYLFVAIQDVNDNVVFARFNMASGTNGAWEIVTGATYDVTLDTNPDGIFDACDLTVESDGTTVHIFYQGTTDRIHGTDYDRIHHLRTDNALSSSVTAATSANNAFGTAGSDEFNWSGPRCIIQDDDTTHVVCTSTQNTPQDILENSVTTGGTPTAASFGDTLFNSDAISYPIGHGIYVNRGGTFKIRFPYTEASTLDLEVLAANRAASPTYSTQNITTSNPDKVNGSVGACLASLGSTIYAAKADDTDNDLDFYEDADSDTWSTFASTVTTNATQVHCNIYDTEAASSPGHTVLATLYDTDGAGGSPVYREDAITISTGSMNDVKMGRFASYHGPYEV